MTSTATPDVDVIAPGDVDGTTPEIDVFPFEDVPTTSTFFNEIDWMVRRGIASVADRFNPGAATTREAMAAFLYRAAGSPEFTPEGQTFPDVPPTSTFYTEIEWMAANNITTGFDDGNFRPGAPVTREVAAAFLYRLAGADYQAQGDLAFDDANNSTFRNEIEWLTTNGITNGFNDGTFRPSSPVTRESMAAFLFRAVEVANVL